MDQTRRSALVWLLGSRLAAAQPPELEDEPPEPGHHKHTFPDDDRDPKLPNGKSQKDAIAAQQHNDALRAAGEMITLAEQVKSELQQAGNFVVPVSTIKKTEEIERLARKIRGKLRSATGPALSRRSRQELAASSPSAADPVPASRASLDR